MNQEQSTQQNNNAKSTTDKPGTNDTLMLLSGGHPVHKKFAESVGAETRFLASRATKNQFVLSKFANLVNGTLSIPSNYNFILCESCYYYPAIKKKLGLLPKSKLINMNFGPLLHHLYSGRLGGVERKILMGLLDSVDGHIVYGSYGLEQLKRLGVEAPARVVYPFISSDLRKVLKPKEQNRKPKNISNNNSRNIQISIVVTSDTYNKGLDLCFAAMKKVHTEIQNAKLNVITRLPNSEISSISGFDPNYINVLHNVPSIATVLQQSSLYLQPSRGDMFPVSTLEALAAGVPCIVSSENGAKEVIETISPKMVVPSGDAGSLANAIMDFFNMSQQEHDRLSSECVASVSGFEEKKALALFKKEFLSLKKELSSP